MERSVSSLMQHTVHHTVRWISEYARSQGIPVPDDIPPPPPFMSHLSGDQQPIAQSVVEQPTTPQTGADEHPDTQTDAEPDHQGAPFLA